MKDGHESVSVCKIDNGYLVERSSQTQSGYNCNTTFHENEPRIKAAKVSSGSGVDTTGFNKHSMRGEIDQAINGKYR